MTDRELEAIKTLAAMLRDGWEDEDLDALSIRLRAQLIMKAYTPEETDTAITYFFRS